MTDQRYPKRLIEVDLPIARISAHARREKDMRLGHIPSLHIYPAARPPAACRAVICATLWPDPADVNCPQFFRDAAVRHLVAFAGRAYPDKITGEDQELRQAASPEGLARWESFVKSGIRLDPRNADHQTLLRFALLDFIADFANWDNSASPAYLETARALTQSAHEALGGTLGSRPLVFDPFAGGGAIPLEALRVGADAFASDLSPVAVLLNKVVLEYIPKYGTRLADEVDRWEDWIEKRAESELSEFYPKDPDGSTPIAYLWARTISCEGPACGAEIPLMRSLWLARKSRNVALNLVPDAKNKRVTFSIVNDPKPGSLHPGTIARGSVTCPCCGFTTPVAAVRLQLAKANGGSDSARLFAVVIDTATEGRQFRVSTSRDLAAIESARTQVRHLAANVGSSSSAFPAEALPPDGTLGFRVRKYGMSTWGHLFNARQLLALSTYARLCQEYTATITDPEFAEATNACLALVVDRLADLNAAMCVWQLNTPNTAHVFGRWALQMNWDYGEVNPLAGAGGSPHSAIRRMTRCIGDLASAHLSPGHVEKCSADQHPLPDDAAAAFITDPPYYDAVPYSDLLNFFYVWLKRSLGDRFRYLVESDLGPNKEEIIVDLVSGKDRAFYEAKMQRAMAEARRVLSPSGVGIVVFAHKSTSGWEAMLQAIINAGLTITGSWPIDTEMGSRLRAKGSAALASSVHLVCRPRENSDGTIAEAVGEWRDVLDELPKRIHEWMPRLAAEGVVGADAIFACLGPALEIFSRYSHVEKANGDAVELREYLEQVWAAVSTEALSLIFAGADAAGLEPDARLTAMWLWTVGGGAPTANGKVSAGESSSDDDAVDEASDDEEESTKSKATAGYTLEFDAARKIAQGLGIHLERSESIVEVKGDKARLLAVSERTRYLFGKNEESAVMAKGKKKKAIKQRSLFEELDTLEAETEGRKGNDGLKPSPGETVLDRVHQAMILFAAGRGEALRRFLVDDGAGTDARFWKLAQSFSALYPVGTDEKRWVDGVLTRKKGLGL